MNFLDELRRRNVVRVAAAYLVAGWAVMQVVELIAAASGMPGWTTSFVLVLMVAGFPIALIIAWAFELTPEGPKLTEARKDGETVKPMGKTDFALIGVLALVVVVVAWQQLAPRAPEAVTVESAVDEAPTGPDPASIAVLAFDDLSESGDQEYFSDGISEELLNVLVRVEGLEVASRTSAFRFKGSDADIPAIAAQMNVRHVVEGSVRRAGETIRVTAQLIDGSNDRHLWSDTYDRDLSTQSIFEIQDEIATAIVAALSEELGTFLPEVEVETATENLTAYELYLQARPIFAERGDMEEADEFLSQALELDPGFAEAWELRAASNLLLSIGAVGGGDDDTARDANGRSRRDLAVEYADQALALEPDSSLAITVKTFLDYPPVPVWSDEPIEAETVRLAIEGYTSALEIDPHNTTALNWRGVTLRYIGFLEEAQTDYTRCLELEPDYASCVVNVVFSHSALGEDEAAYDALITAWDAGMTFIAPYGLLARQEMKGAFLILAAEEFGTGAPWGNHSVLYEVYRDPEGDFDHLIPAIASWAEEEGFRNSPTAAPDVLIGNYEAMPRRAIMIWTPELAPFRASPEFQNFLAATPLPDYWRAYGFPPQCRERDDGWIACD